MTVESMSTIYIENRLTFNFAQETDFVPAQSHSSVAGATCK